MQTIPQLSASILYQAVLSWLLGLNTRRIQVHLPLVAAFIAGLLCLGNKASCTSMAAGMTFSHDAFTRLLRGASLRALQQMVALTLVKRGGGYLVIDDIVNEKYGKVIAGIAWLFSPKLEQKVRALNVVMLGWSNGDIYVPLSFRFWKPPLSRDEKKRPSKDAFDGTPFRTKLELAVDLLKWAKHSGFVPTAVLFDAYYLADPVMSFLKRSNWQWVSRIKSNRNVLHRGITLKPWQWHELVDCGEMRQTKSLPVHLPSWGAIRLVKRRLKGAKEPRYLAASNPNWGSGTIERLYGYRWKIETSFRDGRQWLGLGRCQSRTWQAQENHVALCLLAYCFLVQQAAKDETLGRTILRLKNQSIQLKQKPAHPKVRPIKREVRRRRQKPHPVTLLCQCA